MCMIENLHTLMNLKDISQLKCNKKSIYTKVVFLTLSCISQMTDVKERFSSLSNSELVPVKSVLLTHKNK